MHVAAARAYPTPLSNSALLPLLLLSLARQKHAPDTAAKIKKEYDYVVVGGGAAGSVVASRLSELPCANVLLIEAGDQPPLLTDVPALGKYFWFTDLDWQFRTAPQNNTGRSLVHRQVLWPRGKGLGGSSLLDANLYVRGNRKNYDDWAAEGAEGWSYKDVYPYFLRMENNLDYQFLQNGYHTTGGPVTVHQPRYEPALKRALRKAAVKMGYQIIDSNAKRQTGFYDFQATLRDGQRCSPAKAYLVPAENRTNLDILTNAYVTKVIIKNKQARAVQFEYDDQIYEVGAKREVILSSGPVNTPKILMLSGVGPQEELEKLNIPVEADLPVGRNLQDHGATPVPFVMHPRIPDFEEKISDPRSIQLYIDNRTGPLASTEGINFVAFLKGQAIYTPVDFPNYQISFSEMNTELAKTHFGLKPEVYQKLYSPYEGKPLFLCTVSNLQPRSRGAVTLKSKNPFHSPIIDPRYLENPKDIEDIVQGMKTCQRIATSPELRKLGVRPFKTLVPGCERFAKDEDEYFSCQVRSIFVSLRHPVGTTKMGDPRDPTTVVDPELKVKNIERLRVVDASVMPIIPSGDTLVPTLMVAEKASEMIKESVECYKKELEHWDEEEKEEDSAKWKEDKSAKTDHWNKPKEVTWGHSHNEPDDGSEEQWKKPAKPWKESSEEKDSDYPKKDSWSEKDNSAEKDWSQPAKPSWSNEDSGEKFWNELEMEKPSWSKEGSGEKYWSKPEKTAWTSEDSAEEYSKPKKTPWSNIGKYYLKNYTKTPKMSPEEDYKTYKEGLWKDSKPISWYKEQTEKILRELDSWKDGKSHPKGHWNDKEGFKMSKSLDELVKLADLAPEELKRWSKSYNE